MVAVLSLVGLVGYAVVLAGGFVAGVLVGRRNKNTVEKVVSVVEKNTGL